MRDTSSTEPQSESGLLGKLVEFGLLIVIILAPTQYSFEVVEKTYLSVVDPLIWGLAVLWGIDVLRRRALRSLKLPPPAAFLLVLFAVLSMKNAVSRTASLKDIIQLLEYFIVAYMLFVNTQGCSRCRTRALYAFLGSGTLVVLVGLVQYVQKEAVVPFDVRATFGNSNVFGAFLSILVPFAFGFVLHDQNRRRRVWSGLIVVAGLLCVLSGGSFIAIVVAVAVLSAFGGQKPFLATMGILVLGLVFLPGVLRRDNPTILFESIRLYDDTNEVSSRYTEWQPAMTMAGENPVFGVGAGNYQKNIGSYYGIIPSRAAETAEPDSQNLYLVVASSMGLPGLASFVGLLLFFGVRAARAYSGACKAADRLRMALSLGVLGVVIAVSINGIWTPLIVRGIGVPLAFIFSLAATLKPASASHALAGE